MAVSNGNENWANPAAGRWCFQIDYLLKRKFYLNTSFWKGYALTKLADKFFFKAQRLESDDASRLSPKRNIHRAPESRHIPYVGASRRYSSSIKSPSDFLCFYGNTLLVDNNDFTQQTNDSFDIKLFRIVRIAKNNNISSGSPPVTDLVNN